MLLLSWVRRKSHTPESRGGTRMGLARDLLQHHGGEPAALPWCRSLPERHRHPILESACGLVRSAVARVRRADVTRTNASPASTRLDASTMRRPKGSPSTSAPRITAITGLM